MKLNIEYLKRILEVFQMAERHFVELSDFQSSELEIDNQFLFHMQLLEDQELVEPLNKDKDGLGYVISLAGNFTWVSKPLRLTSEGHEFASALRKSEIWSAIKSEFNETPIGALRTAAKELMTSFAKTQAKKYFGVSENS